MESESAELLKAKEHTLRSGDTFVVWRLDRLGRSLKDLISWTEWFAANNIGFESICEGINTSTSTGKLFVHIFGALSEFEHNLIKERTKAGLEAARARGREGGRPLKLNENKRKLAVDLYNGRKHSIKQICETVGYQSQLCTSMLMECKSKSYRSVRSGLFICWTFREFINN